MYYISSTDLVGVKLNFFMINNFSEKRLHLITPSYTVGFAEK